jgi:triosephosphate isomerase
LRVLSFDHLQVKMLNEAGAIPSNCDVVVAPPTLHVGSVLAAVRKDVKVAVQNSWSEPKAGAWTGELTVDLIKDFGLEWVILGHSERRQFCHESHDLVGKKVRLALEAGLNVIACIGESLAERQGGKTMDVCKAQLDPILANVPAGKLGHVVIAYEPVWAIGTGVTATPQQAQDTHHDIRAYLATKVGASEAAAMRIQYGGSVKGANCEELIRMPDIDGFLVGGASLLPEFAKIIQCAALKAKM